MKNLVLSLAIVVSTLVQAQGLSLQKESNTNHDFAKTESVKISNEDLQSLQVKLREIEKKEFELRIEKNSVIIPQSEIDKLHDLRRKLKEN